MLRRKFLYGLIGLLAAAPALSPAPAAAQFPERPITLIVPWAPGGSTDQTARVLARAAEQYLGQTIVVENRPGASTALGMAALASAAPDGYTIGVLSSTAYLAPLQGHDVPFHPIEDFTFISYYGDNLIGIVVRADAPWQTLEELIEAGRENPNAIKYGTGAVGSTQHLTAEALQLATGAEFVHIPQQGSAGSVPAVLGGHVDFISDTSVWAPFVEDGQLRVLAVTTPERVASFPDVPTMSELGYDTLRSVQAILGPAGMPEDVRMQLESAFRQALTDQSFQETMARLRMEVVDMPGDEVKALVESEYARAADLIDRLGLAGD